MIKIKSQREIELMRQSCRLAARVLDYIETKLVVGMSTDDVDKLCYDFIVANKAIPSSLNYNGFPKSICTSPNEVICHGIPSKKVILKDGDILNVDVAVKLNEFHGDNNRTYLIGNVAPEVAKLVSVTKECLLESIKLVKPGARLGDIGARIQEIAEGNGYSVVREFCGHGIGKDYHEDPQVLHYGKKGTGVELRPGMIFTIEPMINMGKKECRILGDGWTAVTVDGKMSAQFEHTILVTESGVEILTLSENPNEFKTKS
jgi:methionyl aminopeptidase